MKRQIWVWLLSSALVVGCGYLKAPSSFEGELDYKISGNGMPDSSWTSYFKNGKTRVESEDMVQVGDIKNNIYYTLFPAKKTYIAMQINDALSKASTNGFGNVSKTGKTDVILGRPCQEILVETEYGNYSMWGDEELFKIVEEASKGTHSMLDWLKRLKFSGHFALKTVSYEKSGKVSQTTVVTKIEEKHLDDSLFTLPASYTEDPFYKQAQEAMKKLTPTK